MLSYDEMKIQDGLVFKINTGEVVGFSDCGDAAEAGYLDATCGETTDGTDRLEGKSAAFMMQVDFIAVTGGHWTYPVCYYLTRGLEAQSLYDKLMECVAMLDHQGLQVVGLVGDGASTNRSMQQQICKPGLFRAFNLNQLPYDESIAFCMRHPVRREQPIFLFSDYPHIIKKMRNFVHRTYPEAEGKAAQRKVEFGGKQVLWDHFREIYIEDSKNGDQVTRMTKAMLEPNTLTKMSVGLAVKVFEPRVAGGEYTDTEGNTHVFEGMMNRAEYKERMEGSAGLAKLFHAYYESMHCRSPITDINSPRCKAWGRIQQQLDQWKRELKASHGEEWADFYLHRELENDMRVTLNSMMGLTEYLLHEHPGKEVNTYDWTSDVTENAFSQQRAAVPGHHPSAEQVNHAFANLATRQDSGAVLAAQTNKGSYEAVPMQTDAAPSRLQRQQASKSNEFQAWDRVPVEEQQREEQLEAEAAAGSAAGQSIGPRLAGPVAQLLLELRDSMRGKLTVQDEMLLQRIMPPAGQLELAAFIEDVLEALQSERSPIDLASCKLTPAQLKYINEQTTDVERIKEMVLAKQWEKCRNKAHKQLAAHLHHTSHLGSSSAQHVRFSQLVTKLVPAAPPPPPSTPAAAPLRAAHHVTITDDDAHGCELSLFQGATRYLIFHLLARRDRFVYLREHTQRAPTSEPLHRVDDPTAVANIGAWAVHMVAKTKEVKEDTKLASAAARLLGENKANTANFDFASEPELHKYDLHTITSDATAVFMIVANICSAELTLQKINVRRDRTMFVLMDIMATSVPLNEQWEKTLRNAHVLDLDEKKSRRLLYLLVRRYLHQRLPRTLARLETESEGLALRTERKASEKSRKRSGTKAKVSDFVSTESAEATEKAEAEAKAAKQQKAEEDLAVKKRNAEARKAERAQREEEGARNKRKKKETQEEAMSKRRNPPSRRVQANAATAAARARPSTGVVPMETDGPVWEESPSPVE
jgi:hypothetical protein